MRRGHRRAHLVLTLASGMASACLLVAAWVARPSRPAPVAHPFSGAGGADSAPQWSVVLDTPQGPAVAAYSSNGDRGWFHVSLPDGLDAAEPGLILERPGASDTLGSVNSVRSSVAAPKMPAEGGILVLADFARGLRLAEKPLPEPRR